jgi:hypothetical protein
MTNFNPTMLTSKEYLERHDAAMTLMSIRETPAQYVTPSLDDFIEKLPDIPQDKGDLLWWERASDKGIPYIQLRSKHNIGNDGSHMRMGFYKKGSQIELYAWGVIKSEMEHFRGFVNVLNSLNEPWIQNTAKGARGKIGGVRGYGIIVDDLTPVQLMSEINKFLK